MYKRSVMTKILNEDLIPLFTYLMENIYEYVIR
ncbi:hypothetical protein VP501E541_P0108 [Vibrio phage 501E54-1]|nr:hypothetical protein VP501E541_P0108 [Vibrio phage 501E54-1]